MSVGGIIGVVVGGVIGFFFVGGPAGAFYGASIGFSIGMYVDPMTPDIPSTGAPLPIGAEIMVSTIGDPTPDLLGTAKITGHLLCFGKERIVTVMAEHEEAGKGGSSPDPHVAGYEYYMSWVVGIVAGPVATLYTVYRNDDVVWEGELDLPEDANGQETITLDGMGSAEFYFGTADQVANSDVGDIIGDATLNSPYRHFCWCFFDDCYIGDYNRCPTMRFVLRKSPVIAFSGDNEIQIYDYNPIHAIWYTLHDLAGLPETWLHSGDFAAAASTLAAETRGICCLFRMQQSALNYLESINNHIDGIIRYGSDGKFHPKLIRDDYTVEDLPVIDEDVMLDDPTFNRKSWVDTINEVKVQYTEIVANVFIDFIQGKWVAAMPHPNTQHVYLYDILYKEVIKLDVLDPPLVSETLALEPIGSLNYDMGYGNPGAQRGGYCMDKNGGTLWYLFKNGVDGELIEVDVSSSRLMSITKKTVFPGLLTNDIQDGCSDNYYTYWCDGNAGRIIKIRNLDHSIVYDDFFEFTYLPATWLKHGINSVDTYSEKLYWNYVITSGAGSAVVYHSRSDNEAMVKEYELYQSGSGLSTPQWQNMVRVYSGFLFQHRAYWPATGPLWKRDLATLSKHGYVEQNYLQNILGTNDYLFALRQYNIGGLPTQIECINFISMSKISHRVTTSYLGTGNSCVSALSVFANKIIVVGYNAVTQRNCVTGFKADETLSLQYSEVPFRLGRR